MSAEAGRADHGSRQYSKSSTVVTVLCFCLLALALLVVSWRVSGPPQDWWALSVLSLLAVASWILRETDVGARVQLSFGSIILLAAAVIVGPVGAGIVGLASTLIQVGHERFIVRLFNVAMFTSMSTIGALAYLALGGPPGAEGMEGAAELLMFVGLPLIVANFVQCLTNALGLAVILRVSTGVPIRMQMWKLLSTTGPAYIGYGVIGFLFVVLWIPAEVGAFSALLVLAPLFVARWAFVQYGDELRAHERTLRALVTAVETKEPHNAGHSERVAQLSEWVAEVLGLGHREIQDVRTAGMLHDVGKVGVPTRLLRPRKPIGDDDLVLIADHALGGVELVQDIAFLSGSVDGIAHHHERFDGLGYPSGLQGEHIPLVARIVAVADVFDSLTSDRAYRPALTVSAALKELTDRAGTQFDPAVTEALAKALARHEWLPTNRAPEILSSAGVAVDHDEPEVSDLLAARTDLREQIRGTRVGPASGARPLTAVPVQELT